MAVNKFQVYRAAWLPWTVICFLILQVTHQYLFSQPRRDVLTVGMFLEIATRTFLSMELVV